MKTAIAAAVIALLLGAISAISYAGQPIIIKKFSTSYNCIVGDLREDSDTIYASRSLNPCPQAKPDRFYARVGKYERKGKKFDNNHFNEYATVKACLVDLDRVRRVVWPGEVFPMSIMSCVPGTQVPPTGPRNGHPCIVADDRISDCNWLLPADRAKVKASRWYNAKAGTFFVR